jgi:DNA-binding response OmpR family regulator
MPKKTTSTAAAKPAKSSGGSKKRILIVEDERPLSHALELKVGHEGFEVQTALTGADGLREGLTGKYDLILLDLIMPEIDGFGVLQALQEKKVKTPVIVLSNLGQEEDKTRAKSLGAIDYFVKANTPIMDIIKKVKSVL